MCITCGMYGMCRMCITCGIRECKNVYNIHGVCITCRRYGICRLCTTCGMYGM